MLVNNRFDWNFAFRTPYDYLEAFLAVGILLESDTLSLSSTNASPLSDIRTNDAKLSNVDVRTENPLHKSPKEDRNGQQEEPYQNLKHLSTPSTAQGPILVSNLDEHFQTEIRRKIRDSCLEIVEYLSSTSISHPKFHKELAYAVVVYSRKIQKVTDFE